jgi:hypothetical protein
MDAQTAGRRMTELLGLAAEGAVFYTEATDHYNCPVGSYTHGVTLPPERAKELEDVVGTMVGLQYIRVEEVAALPRRAEPFRVAVYAPLAQAPAPPDVVLVRGRARQIMLVAEAARGTGLEGDGATLGRPACAMIPRRAQPAGRRHEPRLHRQPGLHRAGGRRAVLHDPGRESGRGGRAAGDGAARQSPAGAVPPGAPGQPLEPGAGGTIGL